MRRLHSGSTRTRAAFFAKLSSLYQALSATSCIFMLKCCRAAAQQMSKFVEEEAEAQQRGRRGARCPERRRGLDAGVVSRVDEGDPTEIIDLWGVSGVAAEADY